jgi:hypothetical protein
MYISFRNCGRPCKRTGINVSVCGLVYARCLLSKGVESYTQKGLSFRVVNAVIPSRTEEVEHG